MKTKDVNFLEENLTRINKALFKTLPEKESSRVTEAIHYSVMNGGKRIRPVSYTHLTLPTNREV